MNEPGDAHDDVPATRVGVSNLPSFISGAPLPDPSSSGPAAWVGREVDDYRILRVIGAGGMGVVFLAQQRHPKRMVAIKTLHAGLHQADLLARFQQEAEILGRLKHPGIAQIYASGRTDVSLGSVPYIVMEFVEGAPLLEYCSKLDTRGRLQLLMRVCEAVEHAHIRGVIHRDLKPGNILVQTDGHPKVLDFGVARLTGEDHGPSELTSAGMIVGTIAYMSPEQAIGEPGGVDIRTDVYALGMIGYRMLAGEMPYEVTSHNLGRALQQICESPPTPLSRHDRRYRGDLETIFQKVLAKDKEARYQNAAELAEDLRRFLADEAILARRASVFSDIRRFARRNKVLVSAALVVLLALIGAVMVSTRFALQEQEQRLQADAMIDYMRGMFSSANPVFAQGKDVTVREVILQTKEQLERNFASAPGARARMRATLAETFKALGDLPRALEYYRAAEADFVLAQMNGLEPELAEVGEARVLLDSGRVREAEQVLSKLLATPGPATSPARLMAHLHQAAALATLGEVEAARGEFQNGLAALDSPNIGSCKPCLPDWDVRLKIWARTRQSVFESDAGNAAAAENAAQHAVDLAQARLGETDPDTLMAIVHLSMVYRESGQLAEATQLLRSAYAERQRVLTDGHWQTLATATNLADALSAAGDRDDAEQLLRKSLAIAEKSLDSGNPQLSQLHGHLGILLFGARRLDEAEPEFVAAYEISKRNLEPTDPNRLADALNLAVLFTAQGKTDPAKYDRAQSLMKETLAGTEARFGPEHRQTLSARSEYAALLRDRGEYQEADSNFEQAWASAQRLLPAGDKDRLRVLYQYSGSLQRQSRFAEAEILSARLLAEAAVAVDPRSPHAILAPLRHARTLIGLGRRAEAESLIVDLRKRLENEGDDSMRQMTDQTLAELRASGPQ